MRKEEEPRSMFVKPIEGASVRDPETFSILPKGGAVVTLEGRAGTYWRRRLYIDKVVVKVNPSDVEPSVEEKPIAEATETAVPSKRKGR